MQKESFAIKLLQQTLFLFTVFYQGHKWFSKATKWWIKKEAETRLKAINFPPKTGRIVRLGDKA